MAKEAKAAGCNKRAVADKAHARRAACHIFRTVLTPVGMFGISINPRIKRARAVLVLLSCVPSLYHHTVTLLYLLICKVERKLRLSRVLYREAISSLCFKPSFPSDNKA